VPKIIKIRESFPKLQSIMSGSLFLRHSVVNASLHVFQWRLFTLIRVLYKCNLHSYELFWHGSFF